MDEIKSKTCSGCRNNLPVTEFSKCVATNDKLQYQCRACDAAANRAWRSANKLRRLAYNQGYYKDYHTRRYREDPNYRASRLLRSRFRSLIKRKDKSCLALLGISIPEFIGQLERSSGLLFSTKDVHLDHIIPCSYFDLTDPKEVAACFHWKNFQLLRSVDNMKKGARLPKNYGALLRELSDSLGYTIRGFGA